MSLPTFLQCGVWHCNYYQASILCSWMLLRGWGYVSSNPYATPRFHSNLEWSVSSFSMRTDRQVAPDIYSWHCLERLSVREDWYDSLSASCMCLCVCEKDRDRERKENWCLIFFPSQRASTALQVQQSTWGQGRHIQFKSHTHTHTGNVSPEQ